MKLKNITLLCGWQFLFFLTKYTQLITILNKKLRKKLRRKKKKKEKKRWNKNIRCVVLKNNDKSLCLSSAFTTNQALSDPTNSPPRKKSPAAPASNSFLPNPSYLLMSVAYTPTVFTGSALEFPNYPGTRRPQPHVEMDDLSVRRIIHAQSTPHQRVTADLSRQLPSSRNDYAVPAAASTDLVRTDPFQFFFMTAPSKTVQVLMNKW